MIEDDADGDLPDDTPGAREMQLSWDLFQALRILKKTDVNNGRVWAIAVTEAEKLHAWIAYAVGVASDQ